MYLYVSDCAAAAGDVGGGVVGAGAPLSLLLVDAVSLGLWQVEEVLHRLEVDEQRLRGRARVLLLPKDLRQQPLQEIQLHFMKFSSLQQR